MSEKYDHQVEVVVGVVVIRDSKVLLIQSPKWGDRWIFPGGHVEFGEGIFKAAEREGQEETGLKMTAKFVINIGENIFSPDFHRPAHMNYYHVVCETASTETTLNSTEVKKAEWFSFDSALTLDLFPSNRESILRLQAGKKIPFDAKVWAPNPSV